MAKLHLHQERRRLRAAVSVVAALCVLSFAGLVFLHEASWPSMAASAVPGDVGNPPMADDSATSATTGLPSAERVFRGAPYQPPEEQIVQF